MLIIFGWFSLFWLKLWNDNNFVEVAKSTASIETGAEKWENMNHYLVKKQDMTISQVHFVWARIVNRVRDMSRATENVARSVLLGVVKTAGFFSGSLIKSRAGKKVFKLMPGEVALVSLDAFGEYF